MNCCAGSRLAAKVGPHAVAAPSRPAVCRRRSLPQHYQRAPPHSGAAALLKGVKGLAGLTLALRATASGDSHPRYAADEGDLGDQPSNHVRPPSLIAALRKEAFKVFLGACIIASTVFACFFGNRAAIAATAAPPQVAHVQGASRAAQRAAVVGEPQQQYEVADGSQRMTLPFAQPVLKLAAMATTAAMTVLMFRASADTLGPPPTSHGFAPSDPTDPPPPSPPNGVAGDAACILESTTAATEPAFPADLSYLAHHPQPIKSITIDDKGAATPMVFAMGLTAAAWDALQPFGTFVVRDAVPATPSLLVAGAAAADAAAHAAADAAAAAAAAESEAAAAVTAAHHREVEELLAAASAATAAARRAAADANAAAEVALKRRAVSLEAAAALKMQVRGIGGGADVAAAEQPWAGAGTGSEEELEVLTFRFTGQEPTSSQLLYTIQPRPTPQPSTTPLPTTTPALPTPRTPPPPSAALSTPKPTPAPPAVAAAPAPAVNFLTTKEPEDAAPPPPPPTAVPTPAPAPTPTPVEKDSSGGFNLGWTKYIHQLLAAEDRGAEYKGYELVGELLEVGLRSEELREPKYDPLRPLLQRAAADAVRREEEGSEAARWRLVRGLVEKPPRQARGGAKEGGQWDLVYDLLRGLKNAGDPDLILLSTHPKYDPVWALLSAEAPSVASKDDMVSSLLKFALSSPAPSKYDPLQGLLKSNGKLKRSKFDPVGDIQEAARMSDVPFPPSKYCPMTDLLHGPWLQQLEGLDDLPDWDPLKLLVQTARSTLDFPPNKYDMVADLLCADPTASSHTPPAPLDFFGTLLRALQTAPQGLPRPLKFDFLGALMAALQRGPPLNLPDPLSSLRELLHRAPTSLPDPLSSLITALKNILPRGKGAREGPKYDMVADILRLEALGGSSKFDPLAVLERRTGGGFQAVADSFKSMLNDKELQGRHTSVFAAMQRAASTAAADRPAKLCPMWSVLYGRDRGVLLGLFDSLAAANRDFQSAMRALQHKYDPVYSLVAGRDSEVIASVMCSLYKWVEMPELGSAGRWDATTAAAAAAVADAAAAAAADAAAAKAAAYAADAAAADAADVAAAAAEEEEVAGGVAVAVQNAERVVVVDREMAMV